MSFADLWERLGSSYYSAHWLHTWPRRYGFALLIVAAATLVRFGIGAVLGVFPPFVLFLSAIILVALMAGFGPGVFATFLSAASVACFFWAALNVFGTNRISDIIALVLFSCIGTGFSRLADLYHRRETRLAEFERVVQGLEEMIVVVDRDYRYVIANDAFLKYRGMKKEQVVGHQASEILDTRVYQKTVKPKIDECFQGKVVQYELRYRYPSLGERDLFISYFPIEGPKGVERAACVFQDITEKKRAAEELRAKQEDFRILVEQASDAIGIAGVDGKWIDVNSAWTVGQSLSGEDAGLLLVCGVVWTQSGRRRF